MKYTIRPRLTPALNTMLGMETKPASRRASHRLTVTGGTLRPTGGLGDGGIPCYEVTLRLKGPIPPGFTRANWVIVAGRKFPQRELRVDPGSREITLGAYLYNFKPGQYAQLTLSDPKDDARQLVSNRFRINTVRLTVSAIHLKRR